MDRLVAGQGAPIPATTEQALLFLGILFLVGATYAWTQRDSFARRRRQRFEQQGWDWASRFMPDGRWRRVATFFSIIWGTLGLILLLSGLVLLVERG